MNPTIDHRWNVHYDRLSDYQHAAMALPFGVPQLITGLAGSGLTTVAVFRAAALLQAGPQISRPRPVFLATSVLRMRRVRHLLGPLAEHMDVTTVSDWLLRRFVATTGEPAPPPQGVNWMTLALATSSAGASPAFSVMVDDAHHLRPEQLMALRLLTADPFVTAHSAAASSTGASLMLPVAAELDRRRRQPRRVVRVAAAWGAEPPRTDREGSFEDGVVDVRPLSAAQAALDALARWKVNRSSRVVIAPMVTDHVPKIANMLIARGLGRNRLFSSDVPKNAFHRWDVGAGGIYVMQPGQLEGLEFDDVVATDLEHLAGDLSEATNIYRLLALANATRSRLALHWDGSTSDRPPAVRLLDGVDI
ncbi:hypothetical protein EDF18_0030 [Frigoribacterium sp. PhB107]|uniref:hypothetical protein n=1 Tax=Frigoribacterium sp. PhB107 TaxID=2485172 RepID=UPI000FBA6327|nr:hypothetical protein [Frigoribacterium sp. PhB107]ROP77403.1 hypothetical protein EDF18_0030 [Frigoribacterium sp. PhB107]